MPSGVPTRHPSPARSSRGLRDPFIYAAALCVAFTLAFPGDIGWVNDEPAFLLAANAANAQGRLASQILRGSLGAQYSPLPIWLYQAILLVTRNPIQVSVIKNVITLAVVVGGILFLARRLDLSRWPVLLVLLSPWMFHWSRAIWDNNLLIPASLGLWCLTLAFWQRPSPWTFAGAAAVAVLMVHIHPMSLCLLLPWGALLLFFSGGWMRRNWIAPAICLVAGGLACVPYLVSLFAGTSDAGPKPPPSSAPLLSGFLEPTLFTGWPLRRNLPELFEPGFSVPPALLVAATWISSLVCVAIALGTLDAARRRWRRRKELRAWSPAERLSLLALLAIATTWAVFAVTRLDAGLHHFNGVWFAFLLPAWTWIDGIARERAGAIRALVGVQLASLALLLASFVGFVHVNAGTRSLTYGTTLSNQMGVARTVLQYAPESAIRSSVPSIQSFPHELSSLLDLLGPTDRPKGNLPRADLRIHYGENPRDARLYVTPMPPSGH
jgi:hypothetical protein